jgi:hypothetical protein
MSRFECLDALALFFSQRTSCEFTIHHLVAEGSSVAVELTIGMVIEGESISVERHDLILLDDGLIASIHEYGDDGGEGTYLRGESRPSRPDFNSPPRRSPLCGRL